MTRIVLDPGSCHEGKIEKALELVEAAKDAGAWAIKFQLFRKEEQGENIALPLEFFDCLPDIYDIEVFFSIFGDDRQMKWYMDILQGRDKPIKFSYSNRNRLNLIQYALRIFPEVIVTTDIWDRHLLPQAQNLKVLYTISDALRQYPLYPVPFQVDFNFWDCKQGNEYLFNGFSDHTIGYEQTISLLIRPLEILEKHLKLDDTPPTIPDARFAINPREAKIICAYANY